MVQRLPTIKMKRLTAITCVVILLLKLKGFDCTHNVTTTLMLPPTKYASTSSNYSYGGLSSSELAMLCCTDLVLPAPVNAILLLVNALPTSRFLLSFLPPQTVCNILDELAWRPSLLNSIEPPNVVCLVDTLCASPSLLKVTPDRTVCELITAIFLCPRIVDALPPSTVVYLLAKIAPTVLCKLSPAVKASLIRCVLSPKAFGALKPAEISAVADSFASAECSLTGLANPADLVELLKTIALSSALGNRTISVSQTAALLCRLSKTVPALLGCVPPNVVDALLGPFTTPGHRIPAAVLADLVSVLTCPPFSLSSLNPATVTTLLTALSQADVLCTVPSAVLVQLLTDLSSAVLMDAVTAEAIIGLLYGVTCASPHLISDIPTCVRSAYVTRLTSPEVTGTLSMENSVKLIGVLCKTKLFLAELPASSVDVTVTFMISNETLLCATSPTDIVDFIHSVATSSVLLEIPPDNIRKLLSLLNSTSSLKALDSIHFSKLLSSIACCPQLASALPGTQIVNILTTLISVPGALQATSNSVYVNILTQIFTTPDCLSGIPLALFLDLLNQIENQTSDVFCAIPPCAIAAFADFLGTDAAALASLPPVELTALVSLLSKVRCLLAQLSVKTLSALFEAIAESSFAIPLEEKIKLIIAIQSLSPSVFCSLPPKSIGEIAKLLGSFDALGSLSTECLAKLLIVISTCPRLLCVLDHATIRVLLEFLSTSKGTLSALEPKIIDDLTISLLANEQLLTSVPVGCFVQFLLALRTVVPAASYSIPTTTAVALLTSLTSPDIVMDGLTSTDAEDLVDLLNAYHELLAGLPPVVFVNLLTAITNRFAAMPCEKIVYLLASANSASPCLLCAVPEAILTDLLDTIGVQSVLCCLPPECLAAFIATLSSSQCLLDAAPAATLDSLLGLLSSVPALIATAVPPDTLADLCTNLALTPSALKRIDVSIIISLLSAAEPESVRNIPAMVLYTLLAALSNAKTVYELRPTVVASLLRIAAIAPRVLDALAGDILNTIVIKASSSLHLLHNLPPGLLLSFLEAITSSRFAIETLQPINVAHLLISIAEAQPRVLLDLPSATVSALLLGVFGSQQAFASLPPPTLNSLLDVLIAFPNLFANLPLSVLEDLLQFFASSPAILGSIISCTLLKFLAVLSSMPTLLQALLPGTLIAFIEALCTVSPKFLCAIPASIVTALFGAITTEPALATLTPSTVALLISVFDKTPCLILTLPATLLTAFIAFLTANQRLLSDTPKTTLLTFIQNVQSPESIPRVQVVPIGLGLPCVATDRFDNLTAINNNYHSVPIPNGKTHAYDKGADTVTVYNFSSDDYQTLADENNSENSKTDSNVKIIHPENATGTTTVYVFPKKQSIPNKT
ncbi:uncharacterized protein LOC113552400 [Rhopalosiphum maidis]|uniref:uncharacterized protein LOC113552400 n=1 Tax=Rhopalosiphum maidis TaxID=43146 RepID=UPI000EFFFE3B|nr:uncharacterized protein LOC113552400 [Rhopalosiphum maidis]